MFISSTFVDMHKERDYLAKFVFPELKEKCRRLKVDLIDVDLRWGVSEKDAESGRALDICLDEIDSCRPFFVGILGHRYGFIPDGHSHSITAQEIYHGVLHGGIPSQVVDLQRILEGKLEGKGLDAYQRECLARSYRYNFEQKKFVLRDEVDVGDAEVIRQVFERFSTYQRDRSFFFFRTEQLTREFAGGNENDFFESGQAEREKLAKLKRTIQQKDLSFFEYGDIETFADQVGKHLWQKIHEEVEQGKPLLGPDLQEEELHELFLSEKTRRFIGRSTHLEKMQNFFSEDDGSSLIVLTGEPGIGKSALMAKLAEKLSLSHPQWLVIYHAVGASPNSTDIRQTLGRFCSQIYKTCDLETGKKAKLNALDAEESRSAQSEDARTSIEAKRRAIESEYTIPDDYGGRVAGLERFLNIASRGRKICLIIDAVNQLERTHHAHTMLWLPSRIPNNVKVAVSTVEGTCLHALLARQDTPEIMQAEGLSHIEIVDFVNQTLAEIRKDFPNKQVKDFFIEKIRSGNPLYIQVALEELRLFGEFDQLARRIETLPENVLDLFNQVLERIESDFSPSLVEDCMSYIACGRQGMTAGELQILLKNHVQGAGQGEEVSKFPDMLWARLRRSFSSYLFERSGVIDFFHSQLREAVRLRYLKDRDKRRHTHEILGDFFSARWNEPYFRALFELPHQLSRAEDFKRCSEMLTNLSFLQSKLMAGLVDDLLNDYLELRNRGDKAGAELTKVPEYNNFIQTQEYILRKYPSLLFQQALNQPDASKINKDCKKLLSHEKPLLPHFIWRNKPQYDSPCLMTLTEPFQKTDIRCCAFSHDNRLTVSCSLNSITIWNIASGAMLQSIKLNYISPDKCLFVSSVHILVIYSRPGRKSTVEVYQLLDDLEGDDLFGFKNRYGNIIAISGNGRLLAEFTNAKVQIRSIVRDQDVVVLDEETDRIPICHFSYDGNYMLSTSKDKPIRLWDTETGRLLQTFHGHSGSFSFCDFSCDGQLLVASFRDYDLKVWNVATGEELFTIEGNGEPIYSCVFSTDGARILSSHKTCWREWDSRVGNLLNTNHTAESHLDGQMFEYLRSGSMFSRYDSNPIWRSEFGSQLIKQLAGYTEKIQCFAFSGDGRYLATGSFDGVIRVWHVEKCEQLHTPTRHLGSIQTCRFSPDGEKILTSSDKDSTTKIWDYKNGAEMLSLESSPCSVFTPEGSCIVSGLHGLKIHDSLSGELYTELMGHSFVAYRNITPDGKRILSISNYDHTLKVWQAHDKALPLAQISCSPSSYTFSSDNKFLCVGMSDGLLVIWNLARGGMPLELKGHTREVSTCAFSLDNSHLVSSSPHEIIVWEVPRGKLVQRFAYIHPEFIWTSAISGDGRRVAASYLDVNTDKVCLRIWDVVTGKEQHRLIGHTSLPESISFSADHRNIVSGASCSLKIWDVNSGKELQTLIGHKKAIKSCIFSPDGKQILSGSVDGCLKQWEASTGKTLRTLQLQGESIISLLWVDRIIISAHEDGTLKWWDDNTGALLESRSGYYAGSRGCAISSDGKLIAHSPKKGDLLQLWNTNVGARTTIYKMGLLWSYGSVATSADGRFIVHGNDELALTMWDIPGEKKYNTFTGHPDKIQTSCFSLDGRLIATGCKDGTLKLWNAVTGAEEKNLVGHSKAVMDCSFSPDGRMFASCGSDGTIKIWNMVTGAVLHDLAGATGISASCSFSPDARLLFGPSEDKLIKIWDTQTGLELAAFAMLGKCCSLDMGMDNRFVAGDEYGTLSTLQLSKVKSEVPYVTPVYLYLYDQEGWEDTATVLCMWCGCRFPASSSVMEWIENLYISQGIGFADAPSFRLPNEVWDDKGLFSECRKCAKPLRYTPFVVDNRGIC